MTELVEFLKQFDFFTFFSLGIIIWYFTNDLKKSLQIKLDAIDLKLQNMNTRTSRLEGTVYGKDIYKQIDENKGDSW